MIKLFVSDIDGTLINEKHELAKETQVAITKLREAGISFMLASGRNYEGIMEAIKVMDISIKCIALNGGDYRDNDGKSIITYPLEDDKIDKLYAIIENSDVTMEYYCAEGNYTQIDQDKLVDTYIKNFMVMFDLNYAKASKFIKELNISEYMTTEKDLNEIRKHQLIKLEFHFLDIAEKNRVYDLLKQIDGIHLTSSAPLNIEVTHEKATKGNMVEAVCEFYGYRKDEVVVVGDSANDLSMLTRFPNSYAMGNANQNIKDAATHVCADNAHNGVAQIINQILEMQS
ncbi:MAG: Cof-type HAD-IIB family hydrolase [Erysipelotrichia bacterium]|nr:Cof-type HAD-IIB family hydrolase [Erysipelotrichia bacterium]